MAISALSRESAYEVRFWLFRLKPRGRARLIRNAASTSAKAIEMAIKTKRKGMLRLPCAQQSSAGRNFFNMSRSQASGKRLKSAQFLNVEPFSISTAQAVMHARDRFLDRFAGITDQSGLRQFRAIVPEQPSEAVFVRLLSRPSIAKISASAALGSVWDRPDAPASRQRSADIHSGAPGRTSGSLRRLAWAICNLPAHHDRRLRAAAQGLSNFALTGEALV